MKKTYNLRKIRSRRTYNTIEIATLLNVHVQTVRDWKQSGMKPIEQDEVPYLFLGSDIKAYLKNKIDSSKVKLQIGEFYCLSCRKAVKPAKIQTINRSISIGNNKDSIILRSNCPLCRCIINRFSTLQAERTSGSEISNKNINKTAGNFPLFNQEE